MSDFKTKMHQIRLRLGLRPRPRWGSLQRSLRLPSCNALLLRGGKGEGEGRGGIGGEGWEGKRGERGEGRNEFSQLFNPTLTTASRNTLYRVNVKSTPPPVTFVDYFSNACRFLHEILHDC